MAQTVQCAEVQGKRDTYDYQGSCHSGYTAEHGS
jgi:hypothetical protein